jgi:hypothetical protein
MKTIDLNRQLVQSGRTPQVVCQFSEKENNHPLILLAGDVRLDVMCLRTLLMRLPEDEPYIIGRSGMCNYTLPYPQVSRVHCYITKDKSGTYTLLDCSKFGTRVMRIRKETMKDRIMAFFA